MAEKRKGGFRATPQNRLLGAASRGLRSTREALDYVPLPEVLGGGLGTLLVGKSPEEVEQWSYGSSPFYDNYYGTPATAFRIRPERMEGVVDAAGLAAAGVAALGRRVAQAATPAIRRLTSEEIYHASPRVFEPLPGAPYGEFDISKAMSGSGRSDFGYGTYLSDSRKYVKPYGENVYSTQLPKSVARNMFDFRTPLKDQGKIGERALNVLEEAYQAKGLPFDRDMAAAYDGQRMYAELQRVLSGPKKGINLDRREGAVEKKLASEYLRERGIPGHTYPSKDGPTQYVLYPGEEKKLRIVDRKAVGGMIENTTHDRKLI